MGEFTRYELFVLLNQAKPLWLSYIDLSGIDLRGVNLSRAVLIGANLEGVNLTGAEMVEINLGGANLRNAKLVGADLRRAKMRGADLRGADLRESNLAEADLYEAILADSYLVDVNLGGADLTNANLDGANLYRANVPDHRLIKAKSLVGTVMPNGDASEKWEGLKVWRIMGRIYNFDEIIDRSQTDSAKWSINEKLFGRKDVLSMWVADMDFRSPEPVVQALIQRAEQGIYGYPTRRDSYYQAIIDWLQKRHGWETNRSWQVITPGVVPGLNLAIQAFTHPGEKVIIQPPVYHPFFSVVRNNGRQVVENPLINEDGYYRMDYENLEHLLADPRVTMLILCSPHNPVGRVWTLDELSRMGELCLKHNVLVVSDEIHSDLVYSWAKHIPYSSISKEFAAKSITLLAPSKTFNVAGLSTSVAIIPDDRLNTRFCHVVENLGMGGSSIFGMTALEAAYRYGEEWLEQVLDYLEGNLEFLEQTVQTCIPEIKVRKPEGTFLVWLDCRALGLGRADLKKFMIQQAGLGLDEGAVFGTQGEGFMRMNIACPRAVLKQSLDQLANAVKEFNKTPDPVQP